MLYQKIMYQKHDTQHIENLNHAKAQGYKTYYGPACKWQHSGQRWTSNTVCVECARIKARERYRSKTKEQKQDHTGASAHWRKNNLERSMWHSAKSRACRRGLEFDITPEDITIPDTCPVLGIPMVSPSLDRFDNRKGYTRDNIRVISNRANTLKSDASVEEILAILRYMTS